MSSSCMSHRGRRSPPPEPVRRFRADRPERFSAAGAWGMAPTPDPFACIPERSGGTPGGCADYLCDEVLPGEGRLPKDASLDLHPPLRFRKLRSKNRGKRRGGRGAVPRTHLHRTCGAPQVQVCGSGQVSPRRAGACGPNGGLAARTG